MPTHTLSTTVPEGNPVITLAEWVTTLSSDEQTAYALAAATQSAIVEKHKASGKLISVSDNELGGTTFVWADGTEAEQSEQSLAYGEFLARFKDATGTIEHVTIT